MPVRIQIRRTSTIDLAPTGLAQGELAVEMASTPPRLWVGVPGSIDVSGRRLLNPPTSALALAAHQILFGGPAGTIAQSPTLRFASDTLAIGQTHISGANVGIEIAGNLNLIDGSSALIDPTREGGDFSFWWYEDGTGFFGFDFLRRDGTWENVALLEHGLVTLRGGLFLDNAIPAGQVLSKGHDGIVKGGPVTPARPGSVQIGRVCIQWGYAEDTFTIYEPHGVTVTFPRPFASAPWIVHCQLHWAGALAAQSAIYATIFYTSSDAAGAHVVIGPDTATGTIGFSWMAIGDVGA